MIDCIGDLDSGSVEAPISLIKYKIRVGLQYKNISQSGLLGWNSWSNAHLLCTKKETPIKERDTNFMYPDIRVIQ